VARRARLTATDLVRPWGTLRLEAPFLLEELPSEVAFGFVGRLLPTSERSELRLQIHRVPPEHAKEIVDRAHAVAAAELIDDRGASASRAAALERTAASAAELAQRVAAREQELWRVGLAVHAVGRTPALARRRRVALAARFRSLGFRPWIPQYQAAAAAGPPDLEGTEPRPAGYWHTLHTDGVGAFFPFVDETVAEPGGILTGLLLEDASPVFLDRWSHASYSWGVFGTTGAGKSFFAALTALRSRWMDPDLEVIVVDPLGEFAGLARALGGTTISVAGAGAGRWNPLDPASTGGDRSEKAARVATMFRALFPSLRDEETAALDAAVQRLYASGPTTPTLSDLRRTLAENAATPERLHGLLEVFGSGSLRHLDGPTTVPWGRSPTVIDLQGVAEAHLPFHMAYLLDAIQGRLVERAGHSLVIVDEAHLLAHDPATGTYLDQLVRRMRHFGAGVLLLSQNPEDFLRNESGRSLLRNLRATFLLRLSEVSPSTRSFFDLTRTEAEWLPTARLPAEAGYAEALLRLGPAHLPIALVASTPEYEFLHQAPRRATPEDLGKPSGF
jgi:hypothetical protein